MNGTERLSGRGRGAPFGNPVAKKELRRPLNHPVSPTPPPSAAEDRLAEQFQDIDIQSQSGQFNINASEFVPKTSLNITANEFVPSDSMDTENEKGMQDPAVSILYDSMYQLTTEPGRFDSIARQLTIDLNAVIKEYSTLENLAETILENGVNESNFRYTGARLCDYLSLHLTMIIEGATVRQILMQKCNREFKLRETMVNENPERLRGFTLFLAELFQQLEIQVGAVVQRVQVLGNAIPDLILTLASKPVRENVKCIVGTLKCCGSVLEEEERSKPANNGATPVLDRMFNSLKECSEGSELEDSLAEMLINLVKLRNSNWGHSPPSSIQMQPESPGLGTFNLEPVFYAPDGQELTMEEYDFLQEYGGGGGNGNEDEYMGEVQWSTGEDHTGGNGMGDEIEAAYEEFLRTQS